MRHCKVCDAPALPSDDYCGLHMIEAWNRSMVEVFERAMTIREASASVALDKGEIGTRSLPCKHPDGARVTEIVDGHEITYCRMCYEGMA